MLELVECLLHQLLFWCNFYPHALFSDKTKFFLQLKWCRHPFVCNYFSTLLEALSHAQVNGNLKSLVIDLVDRNKPSVLLTSFYVPLNVVHSKSNSSMAYSPLDCRYFLQQAVHHFQAVGHRLHEQGRVEPMLEIRSHSLDPPLLLNRDLQWISISFDLDEEATQYAFVADCISSKQSVALFERSFVYM